MTTAPTTARVEVLTAEVRVLMVGSRQVTLSVYRQLDEIALGGVTLFGRVRAGGEKPRFDDVWETTRVVGADREGRLVASWLAHNTAYDSYADPGGGWGNHGDGERTWDELTDLPLIVLAGLR
jgi:hypothetical protein